MSPIPGYLLAVATVGVAAAVRWPLNSVLGSIGFFTLFLVGITITARYGGIGPALLATALTGGLGVLYFRRYGEGPGISRGEVVQTALSLGLALVITAFLEGQHRAQSRAALAEAESLRLGNTLAAILESVPAVIWESSGPPDSPDQRNAYVSSHVESLLGYRVDEWLATPNFWLSIVHPDDRAAAARRSAENFAAGGAGANRFRWIAKDGTIVWVDSRSHVVTDPQGRPIGMRGVTVDVSARRRAELQAAESEGRFRSVADDAPVLIWMADDRLHCDWCNRSWLEFTGRSLAEACDQGWATSLHPDDLPRWEAALEAARRERRPVVFEARLRRADGEYRWILSHAVPRFAPGDGLLGVVGSSLDIDDRRAAEQERERLLAVAQQASAAAEAANRAKDEFLSTLSHELRTPLNSIAGWAQLMRMKPDPPTLERGLEVIGRSVEAQDRLIQDLLDVSRIVAGKLHLEADDVDLAPVIEAALDLVRPAAAAKGVLLEATLDPRSRVAGDAARLQQIAWNLLANAVKFTPTGGTVTAALARTSHGVELAVSDDGEGIDRELLPRIFERFKQGDSSRQRRHGGLGLGLAIARHLTELQGGTIAATSPGPGRGATFRVAFPALEPAHSVPGGDPVPAPFDLDIDLDATIDERSRLAGVRVLLVDDNRDARELGARTLSLASAEVETAASGFEGIEKLRHFRPHVLVSDIEMPLQDGYEFLAAVRALPEDAGGRVPAAALTAYARAEDRQRALAAGFAVHLAKPVASRALIGAVCRLAEGAAHGAEPKAPPGPAPV